MEQELLTLPERDLSSPPVFSGVRVTRSLVLYHYVCFVYRCLSFSTFFFWPLCCLFFFDIRILIAPFVSSNSSYIIYICTCIIHEYKFDLYSTINRLLSPSSVQDLNNICLFLKESYSLRDSTFKNI